MDIASDLTNLTLIVIGIAHALFAIMMYLDIRQRTTLSVDERTLWRRVVLFMPLGGLTYYTLIARRKGPPKHN